MSTYNRVIHKGDTHKVRNGHRDEIKQKRKTKQKETDIGKRRDRETVKRDTSK